MSSIAGKAPLGWRQICRQIRDSLRVGKNDEAIVKACAINVIQPDDVVIRELLFDAFFQKRDWVPALALIEDLVHRQPNVPRLQKALILTLSNIKRYDKAIKQAYAYIVRHGEDISMLDALKVAYFYTGKLDEAIRYGQRAIELRDAQACANSSSLVITDPIAEPTGANVISYSLWVGHFYYICRRHGRSGASHSLPGWFSRFYVESSVPRHALPIFSDNGGDIHNIADEYPGVGLFQRFLVMDGRTVGRFLVRDCDARPTAAEADLVRQWIDSGYSFHVVRGHYAQRVGAWRPVGRAHRFFVLFL